MNNEKKKQIIAYVFKKQFKDKKEKPGHGSALNRNIFERKEKDPNRNLDGRPIIVEREHKREGTNLEDGLSLMCSNIALLVENMAYLTALNVEERQRR